MATKKKLPNPEFQKPGPEVIKAWDQWWKDVVCEKNGRINKNAVMKELHDYGVLQGLVSKVYMHVTGGMISKPFTDPDTVIAVATDKDNESLEEILKDEKEQWREEYERQPLADVCHVVLGGKTVVFEGRHARVTTPDGAYLVTYRSDSDELFVDDNNPLPPEWQETAYDAVKALLGKE